METGEIKQIEPSFEETFSELDRLGQAKILHCLGEIASAFSLNKNSRIPTETVTSPLITLEKNIGHNNIPSLLASVGIKADNGTLSLTGSMKEIRIYLTRMENVISTTPNIKPQPTCKPFNYADSADRLHESLGIPKPNIDQILGLDPNI